MFRQVWALFPISHSERLILMPLLVATNVQIIERAEAGRRQAHVPTAPTNPGVGM